LRILGGIMKISTWVKFGIWPIGCCLCPSMHKHPRFQRVLVLDKLWMVLTTRTYHPTKCFFYSIMSHWKTPQTIEKSLNII
jgi:hypothetical protein